MRMIAIVFVLVGGCSLNPNVEPVQEVRTRCLCNEQEISCTDTCAPEVVTVTECRCNGELVACEAACEPETVTNTVCRCNGETANCDAACEPVTETTYVCSADGREVADRSDCPVQEIVCEDDQIPFTSVTGDQIGCTDRETPDAGTTEENALVIIDALGLPIENTVVVGAQRIVMSRVVVTPKVDVILSSPRYICNATSSPNGGGGDVDLADHVTSCALYHNQTGALLTGPTEPVNGSAYLTFEDDVFLPSDVPAEIILKCSFATVATDTAVPDGDAYRCFPLDLGLQDQNGDPIAFDRIWRGPNYQYLPLNRITVVDQGLFHKVELDGSSPRSTIILGNSTGVSTSVFAFQAKHEPFIITEIPLDNCVNDAQGPGMPCAIGTRGSDAVAAAVKISYTNQTGATVTKTGFLANGRVTFIGTDFFVPTDRTVTLTVTVDPNAVSSIGAASGDRIQLNLDAVSPASTFTAVGTVSGKTLTQNNVLTYVPANPMTLRKTKPTISLASGSPSGTAIPGMNEVLRISVSADSRGSIPLNSILFKVVSNDFPDGWFLCDLFADPTKWEFTRFSDPSEHLDDDADWGFLTENGTPCQPGSKLVYASLSFRNDPGPHGPEVIGAGVTQTYRLRVDTTGANPQNDDAIRIDIPDQVQASALSNPQWCINWKDDESAAEEIDGKFVKNLPVTGGTIVFVP